jgi:hypothetical protein
MFSSKRVTLFSVCIVAHGGCILGDLFHKNSPATAGNAIVDENNQTGTPQSGPTDPGMRWDVVNEPTGVGYPKGIEGFTTDISVNVGDRVSFKINTDSSHYAVDIYRLGYYQGKGARLMTHIDNAAQHNAQSCDFDLTTRTHDCANWVVTDTWDVPSNAVSGVYLAHIYRYDGDTSENHIPFIVRDDGQKHDIVFQTSDTTWQAYNGWGGYNTYGALNGVDDDEKTKNRAYKVSYNRPINSRWTDLSLYSAAHNFVLGVEVSAIRWLEANGYDVSYISGVDTDRRGGELLNHRVFLSVGHDEYWSENQRNNVEYARDQGVNLAFWSGNEMFRKTYFDPSNVDQTANRVLVTYKDGQNGVTNPTQVWTGPWADYKKTNSLTGQVFASDNPSNPDPLQITVPAGYKDLPFWRNTPNVSKMSGPSYVLPANILGYEWDTAPQDIYTPSNLMRLSQSDFDQDTVISYCFDDGGQLSDGPQAATHYLTLYKAGGPGALVFAAGTVYWAWALDDSHDWFYSQHTQHDKPGDSSWGWVTSPTDPDVRQAMVNLLADMDAQPQSLQPGLQLATKWNY